jgi:hypothetical protein
VFAHGVGGPGSGPWQRCGKLRELFRPTSWRTVTRTPGSVITFCSYKKLAIFTTNVDAENETFGYHKTLCVALNRQFLVGAVMGWAIEV